MAVDVCILGGGPSGLFAAHLLRTRGATTTVIAAQALGALRPVTVHGARVTALPVFSVAESPLNTLLANPRSLSSSSPVQVTYLSPMASGSLQQIDAAGVSAVLTRKLFGDLVPLDGRPLPEELEKKVARHYAHGRPPRIGFVHGISPYLAFLEEIALPTLIPEHVVHIDKVRKIVETQTQRVEYRSLLSTLPLPRLLALLNILPRCKFVAGPAEFHLFETPTDVPPNSLMYDCDPESPLYRLYTATSRFVIAQAAVAGGAADLRKRTRTLLTIDADLSPITSLRLPSCYPLSSGRERTQLISELTASSIYAFGRFGTWEYKDVHELDWSLLNDLA